MSEVTPSSRDGLLSSPEGEKFPSTPASEPGKMARKRSLNAPKGHQSPTGAGTTGDGTGAAESLDSSFTIVRATGAILIDPRLLAEDPDAHRRQACGGRESCSACRFRDVAHNAQREASHAANTLVRAYWRADADALDALAAELGRLPYGKEEMKRWPAPKLSSNGYHIVRAAAPALSGGVCAAISKSVTDKWLQTRFDALVRQIKAPPHFRSTMPLPIRAQELGGVKRTGPGKYTVRFSISPGSAERAGKEFTLPIEARDAYQRRTLDLLSDDSSRPKIGAAQIFQHRTKKGKWLLRIAYSRIVSKSTSTVTAAINRGMVCFLAAATSKGGSWLYDGHDIEAHLKRIQARRRERQRDVIAAGRVGHGRSRTLKPIETLQAAGERWRATKCQAVARRFARWLEGEGVGTLYMEDLAGIRDADAESLEGGRAVWERIQEWPYYQLGMRIKACVEEVGITVKEVPAAFISRRCPKCGHVDVERRGAAPRVYRCSQCRFSRHVDLVAAMNELALASGVWDGNVGAEHNSEGKPRRGGRR